MVILISEKSTVFPFPFLFLYELDPPASFLSREYIYDLVSCLLSFPGLAPNDQSLFSLSTAEYSFSTVSFCTCWFYRPFSVWRVPLFSLLAWLLSFLGPFPDNQSPFSFVYSRAFFFLQSIVLCLLREVSFVMRPKLRYL